MTYRYGSVLRVRNDDPTNDINEGDLIIEAGEYRDGDAYHVLSPANEIVTIRLETVAVYDAGEQSMSESEAKQFAKERYLEATGCGDA